MARQTIIDIQLEGIREGRESGEDLKRLADRFDRDWGI
jgi:hypothetical protein